MAAPSPAFRAAAATTTASSSLFLKDSIIKLSPASRTSFFPFTSNPSSVSARGYCSALRSPSRQYMRRSTCYATMQRQQQRRGFVASGYVASDAAKKSSVLETATAGKEVDVKGETPGTAVVFLNMGGPSTTDEVGDFLTRLFVRTPIPHHHHHPTHTSQVTYQTNTFYITDRRRHNLPRPLPIPNRHPNLQTPHPNNPIPLPRYRRRLTDSQMVRVPIAGDV